MSKQKFNSVQKLVYSMLTECTGVHFLDSGLDNGRHWQRNRLKSIDDFVRESPELIIYDYGYFERTVSTFHFLTSGYLALDDVCKKFNKLNNQCKDWNGELSFCGRSNVYGVCTKAADFLNKLQAICIETYNTCNYSSDLSQVLQFSEIEIYIDGLREIYYLVQIHGGADVRGGYTDAKLFYCTDTYISELCEYKCESEIIEDIRYGTPVYNNHLEELKVEISDDDKVIIHCEDDVIVF